MHEAPPLVRALLGVIIAVLTAGVLAALVVPQPSDAEALAPVAGGGTVGATTPTSAPRVGELVFVSTAPVGAPRALAPLDGKALTSDSSPQTGGYTDLIRSHFGHHTVEALVIAQCESEFSPWAVGTNTDGTHDHGLFQINDVHAPAFPRVTGVAWETGRYDPTANTVFARWLFGTRGMGRVDVSQPARRPELTADPEHARRRRILIVLVILIALFWTLGVVANALAPKLLADHPLLLVALEPRNRYLLLTAGKVDAVPFVVFATFRRIASDPIYFALGHLYGDRATEWLQRQSGDRGGRLVGRLERIFRRFSHVGVFLFPGLVVCVLAGATGMRTRTFLVLNLAGTIAAVIALRLFAQELDGPVTAITEWNDRNSTRLTLITVALVVVWLVWQRRRGRGEVAEIGSLLDLEEPGDDPPV